MTRLFVDQELSPGQPLTLTGDQAHYLLHVLRFRPGSEFIAVDRASRECPVRVDGCEEGSVAATVLSAGEAPPDPQLDLRLFPAVLKGDHFDLVIQKATELGVGSITPVLTARTISRPPQDRARRRADRWRKIAEEACRQCGRASVPAVSEPVMWKDALAQWSAGEIPGLIPYEVLARDAEASLRSVLTRLRPCPALAAFIGPEGGFTPGEIEDAVGAGLLPVSLGTRILRAETASIALCATVMYEMETTE